MEINIYLETKKIDKDYQAALNEYTKRISTWCRLNIITIKKIEKIPQKKSSKLYIVKPSKDTISSEDLSKLINTLNINGYSCVDFVILPERYYNDNYLNMPISTTIENTDFFSVSSFSMDNVLTSVVLSEQLYRAYTIQNNITYHK